MNEKLFNEYRDYEIEIFFQEVEIKNYQFKYKKLDSVQASKSIGAGVRVVKDGKIGQYYSTEANPNYKEMIEKAIISIKYSRDGKFLPSIVESVVDTNVKKSISESEINELIKEIQECIETHTTDGVTFPESSLSLNKTKQGFFTSSGKELLQVNDTYTSVFYAKATSETEEESGYDYIVTSDIRALDLEKIAKNAKEKTKKKLGALKFSENLMVELDYPIVIELLELLLFSFSAENIVKKQSFFLQERYKFLDKKLSIIDDGLLNGGVATTLFDGEGQKRQTTPLVKQGEVVNYLSNMETAKVLGIMSSGNASRKNLTQLGVAPTNIVVSGGTISEDEYQSFGRRVCITEVMGIHMVNPITGEFSLGAKGFLHENGQQKPIRGFVISGNFIEVFKNIEALSPIQKQCGNFLVPKIMVNNIKITG
ncbi:MAG: metallopeptidase TldD-related protein [Fusobacteria bacterium]|nr:metallopeptidase TldD-related protein [Fusobacteriota bacterium]